MSDDPEIVRLQRDRIRRMSTEERAALVRALNRSVEALAVAGIRDAYPDATEREAFLRLAIRKLGYATARHVHPEIAHLEGFGR